MKMQVANQSNDNNDQSMSWSIGSKPTYQSMHVTNKSNMHHRYLYDSICQHEQCLLSH